MTLTAMIGMIWLSGSANADEAVRCDGRLLGIGRSRLEVLRYCGEPQDRISYLDERTTHARFAVLQQGTTQFTRQTGSYIETARDSTTTTTQHSEGDAKREGQPIVLGQTHQHDESKIIQEDNTRITSSYLTLSTYWECKKRTLHVEEFTYNFGAGKFLTFMHFENGRIKAIKYGEYGF
jgi:hypothetical protein